MARKPVASAPVPAPGEKVTPVIEPAGKAVEKPIESKSAKPEQAVGNNAVSPTNAVGDPSAANTGDTGAGINEEPTNPGTGEPDPMPVPVVTLESLPITFGQWELDLRSWSSGTVDCVLRSPEINFFDGYEQSLLMVKIFDHALAVETESAIDPSYDVTGVRLQEAVITPFTTVLKTNDVELRHDMRRELARATEFTLVMGFWPTWPRKGTREIAVPLEGLRPALAALDLCQAL